MKRLLLLLLPLVVIAQEPTMIRNTRNVVWRYQKVVQSGIAGVNVEVTTTRNDVVGFRVLVYGKVNGTDLYNQNVVLRYRSDPTVSIEVPLYGGTIDEIQITSIWVEAIRGIVAQDRPVEGTEYSSWYALPMIER
jgi:hypothetical protein